MPGVSVTSGTYWPTPGAPTPTPTVLSVAGLSGEITAGQLLAALGGTPGASVEVGSTPGTVAAGDDPRIVNAVQSTTIDTLVTLTQAAYDVLTPAVRDDPTVLYVITD
jgi:hypothetical protein